MRVKKWEMVVLFAAAVSMWSGWRLIEISRATHPETVLAQAQETWRVAPLPTKVQGITSNRGRNLFGQVVAPARPVVPPPPTEDPYAKYQAYLAQFHVVGRMRIGGVEEITFAGPQGLLVVKAGTPMDLGLGVDAMDDAAGMVKITLGQDPKFTGGIALPK